MRRRQEEDRRYQDVPTSGNEHYWHNAGAKGYWSIIKPYGGNVVNAAANPSLEADKNRWDAWNGATADRSNLAAIHGNFGLLVVTTMAGQGAYYEAYSNFSMNTPYCACVSIDGPLGAVAELSIRHFGPFGFGMDTVVSTTVTLPGYPVRICVKFPPIAFLPDLPTFPIVIMFDRAGTYSIDGLMLTTTDTPITSYFDGDSQDAVWFGVPHASSSGIAGDSRIYGERINFNEIGFNITGGTGFGLTPRQLITTSFARLNGAHLQRVKDNPRVITLTGTFEGTPEEMHETRQTLIDAMIWRFKNQCTQEMLLCYTLVDECGCQISEELQIPVEYQSGLEGLWGSLDRERATLVFVANSQQSFRSAFDSSADLNVNGTSIIDYEGTDDAWVEVHMWAGAAGMNVAAIHNDTTGHSVYFGYPGGNPVALPLAYGPPTREYAILRTDPAQRISLDLYQYDVSSGIPSGTATQTRIMYYIRYQLSQVGLFRLVPGENQIRAQASLFSTGGRVMLRWRNRYLSVDHLCAGACVEV